MFGALVLELINRSREGGTAARVWPVSRCTSSNRGVLLFRPGTRKKAHASFELCLVDRAIPSELYGLLPKRLCLLGNEPHLALEAQQRMRRRVRFLLLRGTVICRL